MSIDDIVKLPPIEKMGKLLLTQQSTQARKKGKSKYLGTEISLKHTTGRETDGNWLDRLSHNQTKADQEVNRSHSNQSITQGTNGSPRDSTTTCSMSRTKDRTE